MRAVLTALAVAVCLPSIGSAQYTPTWHVGDWWVIRIWEPSTSGKWVWHHKRYSIVGVEKVGKRDCFVLETRYQGPKGQLARTKNVFYVRTDDWLVVRRVTTRTFNDTLCPPATYDCPLGLFGPVQGGEPRLPRFPLRLGVQDTTFKLQRRDDGFAELREISSLADSALVKRLLAEGDTAGERVVRPTSVVYQVRNEVGGDLETDNRRIVQSLQLWSDDQPWRLYEELVQYDGPKPVRRVIERSWLVASSRGER